MKVLFLTQFSSLGGSSRIQVIQFLPILQERGVECTHKEMYPDSFYRIQMRIKKINKLNKKFNLIINLAWVFLKKIWFSLSAFRYDVVVIQKDTFPVTLFAILRFINPKIVYEIDDTIFEINPFLNQGKIEEVLLKYQAKLCKNMMKKSAWVIAENDYLANEAKKHNSHVSVLSAPIDNRIYIPKEKKEVDVVTIGWMGSPSTTYMLEDISEVFKELYGLNKNFRLKVVGASSDFNIEGIDLIKKDWSESEQLSDLQSFDIGLMPLDDSPFQRGRLGYKMIQYMSVGVPVVASNVGLNPTVVRNGQNGFLVDNKQMWKDRLLQLIEDKDLREEMGKTGLLDVEKNFSLQSKANIYLGVFENVSNTGKI